MCIECISTTITHDSCNTMAPTRINKNSMDRLFPRTTRTRREINIYNMNDQENNKVFLHLQKTQQVNRTNCLLILYASAGRLESPLRSVQPQASLSRFCHIVQLSDSQLDNLHSENITKIFIKLHISIYQAQLIESIASVQKVACPGS